MRLRLLHFKTEFPEGYKRYMAFNTVMPGNEPGSLLLRRTEPLTKQQLKNFKIHSTSYSTQTRQMAQSYYKMISIVVNYIKQIKKNKNKYELELYKIATNLSQENNDVHNVFEDLDKNIYEHIYPYIESKEPIAEIKTKSKEKNKYNDNIIKNVNYYHDLVNSKNKDNDLFKVASQFKKENEDVQHAFEEMDQDMFEKLYPYISDEVPFGDDMADYYYNMVKKNKKESNLIDILMLLNDEDYRVQNAFENNYPNELKRMKKAYDKKDNFVEISTENITVKRQKAKALTKSQRMAKLYSTQSIKKAEFYYKMVKTKKKKADLIEVALKIGNDNHEVQMAFKDKYPKQLERMINVV